MKKTNSKLINLPKKIKQQNSRNHQGLHFLSMQVLFSLLDKTLAEEIENLTAIIYSATAYQIDASCKICEEIYHEDDQIVEFDIAFAAPKQDACIKACSDLIACCSFPTYAELAYIKNPRSEKLIAQIWRDEHNQK